MFRAMARLFPQSFALAYLLGALTISALASAQEIVKPLPVDTSRTAGAGVNSIKPHEPMTLEEFFGNDEQAHAETESDGVRRRSLGLVASTDDGIGIGASIDKTWEDAQWTWGTGRQIAHWWNGQTGVNAEVSVHFGYKDAPDSSLALPYTTTGYNVYDAIAGNWPLDQDSGCDLQAADSLGSASTVSLDMMPNGRVVVASQGKHYLDRSDGTRLVDNFIYYQAEEFGCTYDPRIGLNTTGVDSSLYRPLLLNTSEGNYSVSSQIVTQWDGSNTVVHLLLGESLATNLTGPDYCDDELYASCLYFRKTGDQANSGSWSSGQIIDSLTHVWAELAAAPFPHSGVAVAYTNPTPAGALLENDRDKDVWCRESFDRGLTWQTAYNVTNYQNHVANHPNHFTAWIEAGCMFDTEGDLHVYWPGKSTSADPYNDGFIWVDFDMNLYHWEKSNGQSVPGTGIVTKVANGTFMNEDQLSGTMNTYHCGFGGSNCGYIAWITMGECDGKLYLVWSQMHERANRFPWRDAPTQPAPGVLDDCSNTGNRLAMANWELLMSVAKLPSSDLWDEPRNISNTYTPHCGVTGDPDAEGPCGSEWKPSLERFAFDETGFDLIWPPSTAVDLSPGQNYSGGSYLNMEYMDDQLPGPYAWSMRTNPPGTENSEKWIRLACVEPIEESQIAISPESIEWPEWVQLGQVESRPVIITNDGNIALYITTIGTSGGSWLSVSENPTPLTPFMVPAGLNNSDTIQVIINATALSTTQWLDGLVWLKSDAVNADSVAIPLHILAAPVVEPPAWDTVQSHANMFDPVLEPQGECLSLAVGNNGEMGLRGIGRANLDYAESGGECEVASFGEIYLYSGSPFTLLADNSAGLNAALTCSYGDLNQADANGWDPSPDEMGSISGGLAAAGVYDSVYTSKSVNRDTSLALERVFYAPRSNDPDHDTTNFVICVSKVYSGDGLAHDHFTIGHVTDWNVPSQQVNDNTSGISSQGFVYIQGTDLDPGSSCQPNAVRFATEALITWHSAEQLDSDPCIEQTDYWGAFGGTRGLLDDTSLARSGSPLVPAQPDPQAWWSDIAANPDLHGNATPGDQAIWLTFAHDLTLNSSDTLYFVTVFTSVRNGTLSQLEAQVAYAGRWYWNHLRQEGCVVEGACGDVNYSGGPTGSQVDHVTIGDISMLVDHLFMSHGPLPQPPLADVDNVPGITNSDVMQIAGALFVSGDYSSLDCDPTPDSAFPVSLTDTIEFRNTYIPPGADSCVVAVWIDADQPYTGLALPFRFSCPGTAVTLDGILVDPTGVIPSGINKVSDIQPSETAIVGLYDYYYSRVAPSGQYPLAYLYFSMAPSDELRHIEIDTVTYDPNGTTVISRWGFPGPNHNKGTVPVIVESTDSDGDGVVNVLDNCPATANPGQEDSDGDLLGNVCDNCVSVANPSQADADSDGSGDACDQCTDTDHDGFGNTGYQANTCATDNCSSVANPGQADADSDGVGDECDSCTDYDHDGFGDPGYFRNSCADDNCPDRYNPSQENTDQDGFGDSCDVGDVDFLATPRCGASPLSVQFTDLSVPVKTIASWFWDFGDGAYSSEHNPMHEYSGNQSYEVALYISDGAITDSVIRSDYITTQDRIEVDFEGLPRSGRSPLTVMFEPLLVGVANSYYWDFGDGDTSALPNPIHTYNYQGTYHVKLISSLVQDGCEQVDSVIKEHYVVVSDLEADFSANPTVGYEPLTVQFTDRSSGSPTSWFWAFGDGSTSTQRDPIHEYALEGEYDVLLRAGNFVGVDSLKKLSYIHVDSVYVDLETQIATRGWVEFRPGFEFEIVFFWANLGTSPADDCELRMLLPPELEFQDINMYFDSTGRYTGYSLLGDTIVVPLQEMQPSGWFGGFVQAYGLIPETTPIGDTLICKSWLSTTTQEDMLSNNEAVVNLLVVGSWDPNDKIAEPGGKEPVFSIEPDRRIYYTVQFENKEEATADAIFVRVVDTLDPDLNWGTLAMGPMSHPETCTWDFDPYTGVITWYCNQIMLPPNVNPPEGEGYFTYSIKPTEGLPNGTEISNTAWIRFDYNPWLMAPEKGPIVRTIYSGCCVDRVGDANGEGEYPDEVTLGDIMLLVDVKFVSGDCSKLPCVAEADVNQDGSANPNCDDHVTLGDIMTLVDFLFITGPENATLQECL